MKKIEKCYLLFSVFITGGAVLILEILGTRIIGPFYGSTIFVWTSQIIVTLGSLALGYFVGGKIIDRKPEFSILFGSILLSGLLIFLPMKIDQWALVTTDRFGLQYGPLVASLLLFFLPLFLLAMIGPMVIRLVTEIKNESGSVSGNVFAISTLGSIAGAFLAGFYLLPHFSLTVILNCTGIVLILISFVGFCIVKVIKMRLFILFLFLAVGLYAVPKYVYSDAYSVTILHHQQSYYGDLKVIEIAGLRCVTVDGGTESCRNVGGGLIGPYFSEIAGLINRVTEGNILILGSGGGDLLEAGLKAKNVTLVDIDQHLVDVSEKYLGFQPAGKNLHIDDARHFLQTDKHSYDLIFADLAKGANPPYYVFSKEGFELMARRLNPNGTVILHTFGSIGEKDAPFASIVKSAMIVFPSVYITTSSPDENTSYLLHLPLDPEYKKPQPKPADIFQEATVDMSLGMVLTDDFNPLDSQSVEKSMKLLHMVRNYAGLRGVFSL